MNATEQSSVSRTFAAIGRELQCIRNQSAALDPVMIANHVQTAESLLDILQAQMGETKPMAVEYMNSPAAQGIRLRALRMALNKTAAAMCEELDGISTSRWSNWERGRAAIDLNVAIAIKAKYGVPLDFIFAGDTGGMPAQLAAKIVGAAA